MSISLVNIMVNFKRFYITSKKYKNLLGVHKIFIRIYLFMFHYRNSPLII